MPAIMLQSAQSLLLRLRANGNHLGTATGFVVLTKKGPLLITNRHVFTGRHQANGKVLSTTTGAVPDEVVIVHNSDWGLGFWIERSEPLYSGENRLWIEHPTLGTKADLAALPLTQLTNVKIFPYDLENLGTNIRVGVADVISVVGFPFGRTAGGSFAIWATGFVASERALDFDDLPIFLIDCRSRKGQSGSPVLAFRSSGSVTLDNGVTSFFDGPVSLLLGIYSGRIDPDSDVGMVWKTAAIRQLVGEHMNGIGCF